tara:strand:+ start:22101 stop:22493 length:393 start_codon:yes stop_codon:yes gene_type:complete
MSWDSILKAGNCYMSAYTYVFNDYVKNNGTKLLLVHAEVTGTGGNVANIKYGHAFVLDGDYVIDTEALTKGLNHRYPYEEYYAIGKIENEEIYNFNEMLAHSQLNGHYGPWPPANEEVNSMINMLRGNKK